MKLSASDVLAIFEARALLNNHESNVFTSRELAKKYGISERTVRDIWSRRSRRSLTKPKWTVEEVLSENKKRRMGRPPGAKDTAPRQRPRTKQESTSDLEALSTIQPQQSDAGGSQSGSQHRRGESNSTGHDSGTASPCPQGSTAGLPAAQQAAYEQWVLSLREQGSRLGQQLGVHAEMSNQAFSSHASNATKTTLGTLPHRQMFPNQQCLAPSSFSQPLFSNLQRPALQAQTPNDFSSQPPSSSTSLPLSRRLPTGKRIPPQGNPEIDNVNNVNNVNNIGAFGQQRSSGAPAGAAAVGVAPSLLLKKSVGALPSDPGMPSQRPPCAAPLFASPTTFPPSSRSPGQVLDPAGGGCATWIVGSPSPQLQHAAQPPQPQPQQHWQHRDFWQWLGLQAPASEQRAQSEQPCLLAAAAQTHFRVRMPSAHMQPPSPAGWSHGDASALPQPLAPSSSSSSGPGAHGLASHSAMPGPVAPQGRTRVARDAGPGPTGSAFHASLQVEHPRWPLQLEAAGLGPGPHWQAGALAPSLSPAAAYTQADLLAGSEPGAASAASGYRMMGGYRDASVSLGALHGGAPLL